MVLLLRMKNERKNKRKIINYLYDVYIRFISIICCWLGVVDLAAKNP